MTTPDLAKHLMQERVDPTLAAGHRVGLAATDAPHAEAMPVVEGH